MNENSTIYLKFSAVLGTTSAKSSNLILPTSVLPMEMSKKTTGLLEFLNCDWIWLQEDIIKQLNWTRERLSGQKKQEIIVNN